MGLLHKSKVERVTIRQGETLNRYSFLVYQMMKSWRKECVQLTVEKKKKTIPGSANKEDTRNSLLQVQIIEGVTHLFFTFLFYLIAVLVISKFANQAYRFTYSIFGSVAYEKGIGTEKTLQVKKNDTWKDVAVRLEELNLIANHHSFYIRCKLECPKGSAPVPGKYKLNSNQTYIEFIEVLNGDTVVTEDD